MELDGLPSTVMPPPAVTLTFDLLTLKSNQHIYETKYICDKNQVKFPSLVPEIWCPQGFRDAQTRTLTHSRTDRLKYRMPPAPFFNGGKSGNGSWHLEVPDEVRLGMVAVELVVEQLPVGFALDTLTMFAQNDQLLLRCLLL